MQALPAMMALSALLTLPSASPAGPPEAPSGRAALDAVADGLRRCQREADPTRRAGWQRRLAATRDARVGVALGQALSDGAPEVRSAAVVGLLEHYVELADLINDARLRLSDEQEALHWWKGHEADLRRRARQLPR